MLVVWLVLTNFTKITKSMEKLELLTKLNGLVQSGTSKAVIEREVGLPKNSLSSVLTGVKEMPNKWVAKFGGYFEKLVVAEGKDSVQIAVNTLLSTEMVKRSEGTSWQRACLICGEVYAINEFCAKKGFPPSELIEKFDQLEADANTWRLRMAQTAAAIENNPPAVTTSTSNKPHTAPQIEKRVQDEPEFKNGHQKAEISPETGLAIEGMPEGLTAIQQAVWKNNQKMKTKPAPIAGFGLTKKEKS
jgi:hypothetical protein